MIFDPGYSATAWHLTVARTKRQPSLELVTKRIAPDRIAKEKHVLSTFLPTVNTLATNNRGEDLTLPVKHRYGWSPLNGILGALILSGVMMLTSSVSSPANAQSARSASVPVAALMKKGPLPDLVYGNVNAPVTIIEYASMTCPHCATFHNEILPQLKRKYIDTGKARLIFREFPLDNLAGGAAMLARCAGTPAKTLKMIDILMRKQKIWAYTRSNPVPALMKIAKQAGFTEKAFDRCLKNQSLLSKISKQRARASKVFGVNSTPYFFINGKRLRSGSMAEFDAVIQAAK